MSEKFVTPPNFHKVLAAVGVRQFFENYWQQRTLNFLLAPQEFQSVLHAVGPLEIGRFCALAREGARAWLATDFVAHSVIPVDAANADKFFNVGATLYFVNVPVAPLTNALADFLGAPRQKVIASLFLTPAGGGASNHFDKNENFTVQLTGNKDWIVGESPAVASPADGYVLGQAMPPSMASMAPIVSSGATNRVRLDPGTLLYVPRGTVHQTASGTASWSLNLSYSPSMWIDLLVGGLRRQLSSSERWRQTVTGVGVACDSHALDASMLPVLVRELRDLLDDPLQVEQLARQFLENPDG